ncbi:MAG: hypothetical protein QOE70_1986 [Chthoniobacter sp.]|jgi:plasmid stabilization system protein ParE|nr:hypothetical protein [Chthoniobacter sp.]
MLEIVWTQRAERQLQHVFSEFDRFSPTVAVAWLEEVGTRSSLLAHFPEMAPVWRQPYRRLLLRRELGLFYTVEPRGIIIADSIRSR